MVHNDLAAITAHIYALFVLLASHFVLAVFDLCTKVNNIGLLVFVTYEYVLKLKSIQLWCKFKRIEKGEGYTTWEVMPRQNG